MAFPVENIRSLCAENGITLAELERELKIGNGVIARWENAKRQPAIDKLQKIADRFGVPLSRLSGINTEKENPTAEGDGMENISDIKKKLIERILSGSEEQALFLKAYLDGHDEYFK